MHGISTASEEAYRFKQRSSRPQGTGLDYATVMKVWQSGDLDQLKNMLPMNSKMNIEAYDDGWDISVPGRKIPITVNPNNPEDLPLFLKALGISGVNATPYAGVKIDLDKI